MTSSPRVSVGLPVFNGQAHIEQTLESLLGQDLREFELIITDNASTDATQAICRQYARRDERIRYYRNECNLGAAWNYNRAFSLARAPLFKWAPHDDLYAPSYLRRCVQMLEAASPRVVLCYPKTLLIDEEGAPQGEYEDGMDIREPTGPQRLYRLLQHGTTWCHPVVGVIRTHVLQSTRLIGGYAGSDHVLLAELALRGEFHQVPERLFYRRVFRGESPSLAANAAPEARAAWFDTRKREQIAMPRTRLLFEHFRAIHRAPLSVRERWACYRLLRHAALSEQWGRPLLAEELVRFVRMSTWDRYVLRGVRRKGSNYLPHRMWALLSGLKRMELHCIALAFSPPSRATHAALLEFVAGCLSQRSDRESREILEECLQSQQTASCTGREVACGQKVPRSTGEGG